MEGQKCETDQKEAGRAGAAEARELSSVAFTCLSHYSAFAFALPVLQN